jgi:peptidoglycan/xylan/chitin deacetylase (PgdA/CDA1 family)
MHKRSKTIIWAGLETLYFSGGHHVARRFLSGVGAILTLHHVRPPRPDAFQPNRTLEITPEFLDEAVTRLKGQGIDLVSLDEAHRRLRDGDFARRFVALTFDDGYRDNRDHALPILKKHGVPFTLFVPSSFAEGTGDLWWIVLERAIAKSQAIEVAMNGETRRFECATDAAKEETVTTVYWWLRTLASETEMRAIVAGLAARAGVDTGGICREFCMDWEELRPLARDPLCTIGAHTDTHIMLRKATADVARAEMQAGVERIEAMLGLRPRHFSFPVGDPTSAGPREFALAGELGFATAVTTRPGILFPEHSAHLTALPRISVNGDFQRLRYLDVLLSGAPSYLLNRFKRVAAA